MNWQTVVSLLIVTLAAAAVLWGWWRRRPKAQQAGRKFSFARDTHCGCSIREPSPHSGAIVFHARKGERPQIIVRSK